MADVGKIRKEFRRAVALACAGGIWLTGTVANAGFIRVVGEDFSADRMHTVRDGEGYWRRRTIGARMWRQGTTAQRRLACG